MRYAIGNNKTGLLIGIFDGENELAAYRAMLFDAGYTGPNDVIEFDSIPENITVAPFDYVCPECNTTTDNLKYICDSFAECRSCGHQANKESFIAL